MHYEGVENQNTAPNVEEQKLESSDEANQSPKVASGIPPVSRPHRCSAYQNPYDVDLLFFCSIQ